MNVACAEEHLLDASYAVLSRDHDSSPGERHVPQTETVLLLADINDLSLTYKTSTFNGWFHILQIGKR